MAIEQKMDSIGFCKAGADLRTKQFYCVKVTGVLEVGLTSADGEGFLGVLQNKPNTGEAAEVMVNGVTKVEAGAGGLTAGTFWEAANGGTAITAATGKVAGGVVLTTAAAGEIASVSIGFGANNAVA